MKGHIRARGKNTWAIKYELDPDPATGKRRSKWVTVHGTKRDAQKELRRILHEIDNNQHVEPSRLTVGDFLEQWLADHAQHNVGRKTFERYAEIVRKHLIPALGNHQILKLSPLQIQAYYSEALTNGRCDGTGGLSKQTVKHHHRLLSQALRQAVRWQLLTRNPCEQVDPPRPDHTEMSMVNHAEAARLLKGAESLRIYMPILMALTTGMRRGEILGLGWRDVDFERARIGVTQTLEQTAEGLALKAPKTPRSRRTITLGPTALEALKRHKAQQAAQRLRMGPAYEDRGLVCAQLDGSPMSPREVSKEFSRLTSRLGLRVRFHDLRHTHISHMLAEGIHPKIVSERAGHASVSITLDVYSHVMPGLQEDAANRVDEALQRALEIE